MIISQVREMRLNWECYGYSTFILEKNFSLPQKITCTPELFYELISVPNKLF